MINCQSYFDLLSACIQGLPYDQIEHVAKILVRAYKRQRTVFLFGNGGSAALASHLACDLGKGTANGSKKGFRVMALTDNVPLMTAWANDSQYEDIFAEQLANFVGLGDVSFAISGSGNSPNVLKALRVARQAASRLGLPDLPAGVMLALCDACIVIPSDNMQMIEDLHLCVAHAPFSSIRSTISQYSKVTPSRGQS